MQSMDEIVWHSAISFGNRSFIRYQNDIVGTFEFVLHFLRCDTVTVSQNQTLSLILTFEDFLIRIYSY